MTPRVEQLYDLISRLQTDEQLIALAMIGECEKQKEQSDSNPYLISSHEIEELKNCLMTGLENARFSLELHQHLK